MYVKPTVLNCPTVYSVFALNSNPDQYAEIPMFLNLRLDLKCIINKLVKWLLR